jgi:glycosyltransferase involved in cell wall biosynthesis
VEKSLAEHTLPDLAGAPGAPPRRADSLDLMAVTNLPMPPLRILHLNSMLKGGGTDDRSVRIAHALLGLGNRVWMAGPAGREFSKVTEALGIPLVAVESGPLKLPLIFDVARFLRREKVQIVHARHGRDYWPAIFAARLSGVRPKVVLSRHLAKSPGSFVSRRFLLGQCDAMIAVSEFVARVLREGDADLESDNPERHWRAPMRGDFSKIQVVYGGFDMARFRPSEAPEQRKAWGLAPGEYAFGLVGGYSLPRGKGQPEFLKAAARMRLDVPHTRFLVVGRGNMASLLEQQIRELGLSGVARLTPYSYDMPAGMNALDCLVLPQVGTEAIPGVVIEAHACGKPVIASDLDGIPEAFKVGGYGALVQRGSIEELAGAMKHWAKRPPLDMAGRMELHQRVARKFSLEGAARSLSAVYYKVMGLPGEQAQVLESAFHVQGKPV